MPLSPKYRLSMKTEGGAIGVDSTRGDSLYFVNGIHVKR